MEVTTDRLWTVWTTRKRPRLDHLAHSACDDGVDHWSVVKSVLFRLTKTLKYAIMFCRGSVSGVKGGEIDGG